MLHVAHQRILPEQIASQSFLIFLRLHEFFSASEGNIRFINIPQRDFKRADRSSMKGSFVSENFMQGRGDGELQH